MNGLKQLLKMGSYFLISLLCLNAHANLNDELTFIKQNSENLKSHAPLVKQYKKKSNSQNDFSPYIHSLANHFSQDKKDESANQDMMLLVSFSMPPSLLFKLADEASRYQIPLIVKGLKDDDFKKTVDTFYKLNQEASKKHLNFEGISIDPFWFQELHIEKVPALVVIERARDCTANTHCPTQKYDVVYGNSKIANALHLIAEKGELSARVRALLDKYHV